MEAKNGTADYIREMQRIKLQQKVDSCVAMIISAIQSKIQNEDFMGDSMTLEWPNSFVDADHIAGAIVDLRQRGFTCGEPREKGNFILLDISWKFPQSGF